MPGPRSFKTEVIPFGIHQARWLNANYPNGPSNTITGQGSCWNDLITTEGHPHSHLGETPGDIGGPFQVLKRDYDESSTNASPMRFYAPGATAIQYKQFAATNVVSNSNFPTVVNTNCDELGALGTTIIANVLPTNPLAGLSTALGEIREGIPSLVGADFFKHRASVARNAGSEFLNVQFGWLPLISDLKKFSTSVRDSDILIKKYEANSGKRLKRRVTLPTISSTHVEKVPGIPSPGLADSYGAYNGIGSKLVTETTSRRIWFSGCFTYYLPPFRENDLNIERNEQLYNYLYGTRVTPEVLWDLAPWSWAADWFGNFGSICHNVAAFQQDGLVMPYAYIMEEKISRKRVDATQTFNGYGTRQYMQSFTTTGKKRCKASPYGFGLTFEDFSLRQIAIIASLGLTKSSSQYRDF